MMNSILERWQLAQIEERKFHTGSFDHYMESYKHYFKYLGIKPGLENKKIVEIGPADYPALAYCSDIGESFVIEPMPSEVLKTFNIPIVTDCAEDVFYQADEVWLMNVLQHTIDPNKIIERAKKQAKVIRFFEPINYGVDECHLWNFTLEDFKNWFGDSVEYYPKNETAKNFHTWECAYGIYEI